MTFFDFVIGVSMGVIIANSIVGQIFTPLSALVTFIILSILVIATGYIHTKSSKLRKIINSTPDILIDNGNILNENLKNIGLDRNWLLSQLTSQRIKDPSEVFYAGTDNSKKLYVSKKQFRMAT